ncbi:MAG: glycosyltransferase family 4 protein [Chloroflexi bacterium]|nr:glycosyltransferase family 4 protein [Chloroflexota bacterium]
MRVLMLSWEYPPHNVGGLGKHVTELIPELNRKGVEIHLLTPGWRGGDAEEIVDGGEADTTVHRVEPGWVDRIDFFTQAQRTNLNLELFGRGLIDRMGKFDLIHAHDWLVAQAGIALKHAYKTPLIATIHATEHGRNRGWLGGEIQRAIHNVEWWLTFEAWRVIACSNYMRREIEQVLRSPWDKIDVVPNGVETGRFDCLEGVDLAEFRTHYGAPDERIVFSVGRIVPEKGLQVLLEAVPRVLSQQPKTKFIIAGTGEYASHLKHRAWELGVSDRVYFAGFISDEARDRLFKVADLAVFPSIYEPFGIVALEAMAARTPVVVTDVGGFAEVVENNETGMKAYPDNPDSLAWAILHCLLRPDWSQARVENAYKKVRSLYDWSHIAQQTKDVYQRVADERKTTVW